MRLPTHLLLTVVLLGVACSSPPRRQVRRPAEVPAEVTVGSSATIAGYYEATLEKGPTESWLVGLTIAPDERSAELVTLQDPTAPWAGYTTLSIERTGNEVVLRVVSRTTSVGTEVAIPGVQAGEVAFTLTVDGAPRGTPPTGSVRTKWGAFHPEGAVPRGFVIAEPEMLGP